MQVMKYHQDHKNPRDALGGDAISEITKSQEMH
jgi:hypothetical protein